MSASVGTGFKHAQAREIRALLDGIKADRPAIAKKGKNLVFVRLELVAEIEYRGWTDDGKLRHSSFKGFRDTAEAAGIYEFEDDFDNSRRGFVESYNSHGP